MLGIQEFRIMQKNAIGVFIKSLSDKSVKTATDDLRLMDLGSVPRLQHPI